MKQPNHLANQKSPYLLQHVDNPVDWYPWDKQALLKAKQEEKPILLSIGYSTCHWCHVMAHESFENDDIAKVINEHFVAVKVDREERPDLDQIYMMATTAMTGQGGWPLTVFLTPEGKPFYGGTYFPPMAKWGSPGFMDLLNTIAQGWKNQREEILSSSEQITQLLAEQTKKFAISPSSVIPGPELLESAYRQIAAQFDPHQGGFATAPKFPMGHYLSFLLRYHKRNQDERALSMVEMTLEAIARGGICDQLGGGFHRYSTDAQWHVPHFEKMLYDQALLVKAYLECYQITGKLHYAQVAQDALDYVLRDMQHAAGGFYSAEDADSLVPGTTHKSEGAFYIWAQDEIAKLLTAEEAMVFNYVFGVEASGNAQHDPHGEFTGKNILYQAHPLEEAANHFKMDLGKIQDLLDQGKHKLLSHRSSRTRPHLDDKILTDWNGLMLGVLAFAGAVLNEDKYTQAAVKAADFILHHLKTDKGLNHRWRQEEAGIQGTLEDYAFFINGLLDLYEVSFNPGYLAEAKALAQQMLDLFEDKEHGGFYLTAEDNPDLIIRPKEIYDGAIPSGNSVAVFVLERLYLISSEPQWRLCATRVFKAFAASIEKSPSAYTFALCALDFYIGPSCSIAIEGSLSDTMTKQMQQLVYKHFIPNKSLLFRPTGSQATVHLCHGSVCQKPVQVVGELEKHLLQT